MWGTHMLTQEMASGTPPRPGLEFAIIVYVHLVKAKSQTFVYYSVGCTDHPVANVLLFPKIYSLIAFYQRIAELWCHVTYFSNVPLET